MRPLLLCTLIGCVDLPLEPSQFACSAGGPCDGGAQPDGEVGPGDAGARDGDPSDTGNAGDSGDTGNACSAGPSGTWLPLSVTGAVPRSGHSAVEDTINNRALIFGGEGSDSTVLSFSTASLAFVPLTLTGTTPPPRSEHAAAYIDEDEGEMMVFGGLTPGGAELGDAWRLSLFQASWIHETEGLVSPRHSAAAAVLQSVVWYIAIHSGCDAAGPLPDDQEFDVIINQVGPLSSNSPRPAPRCDQTATFIQDVGTLIFGGRSTSALADLWSLKEDVSNGLPFQRNWTELSRGPPRSGHTAVFDPARNRLLVFGGVDAAGAPSGEVWAYALGGDCWSLLAPTGTAPSARAQHAAVMLNGAMYLYGGDDGAIVGDVWQLSF